MKDTPTTNTEESPKSGSASSCKPKDIAASSDRQSKNTRTRSHKTPHHLATKKQKSNRPTTRLVFTILAICLWVVFSVIAVQFILAKILMTFIPTDTLSQPIWTTLFSVFTYLIALFLVIFIPAKCFKSMKTTRSDLGIKGTPTWTDIGLAITGTIASLILAAIFIQIFSLFPWFNASETQEIGYSTYLSTGDRILAFVSLVVVAPIAEEIIFRGWLYGKLRDLFTDKLSNIAGTIISILITSVLFGFVHLQWNVGVNVFALSIILCLLREITGTTYAGIITHMLRNGLALYLLFLGIV